MHEILRAKAVGLIATALILAVLAGCAAPPAGDSAAPTAEPTAEATAEPAAEACEATTPRRTEIDLAGNFDGIPFELPDGLSYIMDQLIVVGFPDDIDEVWMNHPTVAEYDLQFQPEATITFGFLDGAENLIDFQTPFDNVDGRSIHELEIRLATIGTGADPQSIQNSLYDATAELFATGELSAPVLTSVNSAVQGPEIGASGNSVGAHPKGSAGGGSTDPDFKAQWALGDGYGIGLIDPATGRRTVPMLPPDTRRIVLFDTSPYSDVSSSEPEIKTLPLYVSGNRGGKEISVVHPYPVNLGTGEAPSFSSSHGLFALSLAHMVDPCADLELVRVLDDKGIGDLYRMLAAVVSHLKLTVASDDSLAGTVLNFSLGTDENSLEYLCDTDDEEAYAFLRQINDLYGEYGPDTGCMTVPPYPLKQVMATAHGLGAIIVASSGNDSESTNIEPAEFPAAYENVVGVVASTQDGGRACFSNRGNVAAPGGNGFTDQSTDCNPDVLDNEALCSGPACEYGLIGLVLSNLAPEEYAFAYWSGTSFAAPLVSGLASLGLGTGIDPIQVGDDIKALVCPLADDQGAVDHALVNVRVMLTGDPCP